MLLTAAAYLTWVDFFLYLLVELPVLDNEMFHSIKPGLSAYADSPEMVSSLSCLINYIEPKQKVRWLFINPANNLTQQGLALLTTVSGDSSSLICNT